MQMAGTESLYFYIGAPVLLWPTLPSVAVKWLADHPALSAIRQAKDIYIAGSENTTLQLPYELIKNKEHVLKELNQFR